MELDEALLAHGRELPGNVIIKAAGNMGYPMGLRTERLAREIMSFAHAYGLPFEAVAGWGADPNTMIGAGARQRQAGAGQHPTAHWRRWGRNCGSGQPAHPRALYAPFGDDR